MGSRPPPPPELELPVAGVVGVGSGVGVGVGVGEGVGVIEGGVTGGDVGGEDVPPMLTCTIALALPPAPRQVSWKLVVDWIGPTVSDPFVAFVPAQPLDAEQPSAPVLVHVSVVVLPAATALGEALSVTVGVAAAASAMTRAEPEPGLRSDGAPDEF